jgi:hypothetical protein
MARLDMERGEFKVRSIELAALETEEISLLAGRKIKGSAGLKVEVMREETGGLGLGFKSAFKDLSVTGFEMLPGDSHGELSAMFTVAPDFSSVDVDAGMVVNTPSMGTGGVFNAALKGAYDVEGDGFKVRGAKLSSPLLGSFTLEGSIKGFRADSVTFALAMGGENVSLSNLRRHILEPLGIGPEGYEFKGLLDGKARLKGSLAERVSWHSELTARKLSIDSESFTIDLKEKPLRTVSRGFYDPLKDRLELESLEASLPGFGPLTLRGSLNEVSSGEPNINIIARGGEIPLADTMGFFSGPTFERLEGVDVTGQGKLKLSLGGTPGSPVVRGEVHTRGDRVKTEWAAITGFNAGAKLEYGKDGYILKEILVKAGSVQMAVAEKDGLELSLNNPVLSIPHLNYDQETFKVVDIGLKAPTAVVYSNGEEYLKDKDFSIAGGLEGDFIQKRVRLTGLTLNTGAIRDLSIVASLDLNAPYTLEGEVDYRGLDLEDLWPRFSPEAYKGFSVKGTGRMGSSFKATVTEGEDYRVTGSADLKISGGGFSSHDATMIGEGIVTQASSSFELDFPLKKARLSVDASATDFELLLGRFYGNFKEKGVFLSAEAEYRKDSDTLKVSRADINLADIVTVGVRGEVSTLTDTALFDTVVDVKRISNAEAYELFIRDTYQESFPFLARLSMDGTSSGVISLKVSLKGSQEGLKATGEVNVMNADVISKEEKGAEFSATGIDITLPLDIAWPEAGPSPPSAPSHEEPQNFGSLTVKKISWGALEIKELELLPVVWQNALLLKEDITLPVFGGNVSVKDFHLRDVLDTGKGLELSMEVARVDMSKLSVALGLPEFGGSLSGTVPRINLVGTSLITEGEINLVVFGGELRVSEISVNDVLSPVAALEVTLEFKDIALRSLTDTFEFGHISGILQGSVEDLVMVNGQPESFVAQVETVKTRGVSQKISVEALEKISILGTGSPSRILSRGVYQFFKEYNYSKMGFTGKLKNDNFLLLGIETMEGKGYLVKGTLLPPKVDVITYTQNVSFKEMVKRLKRVKTVGMEEGIRVE